MRYKEENIFELSWPGSRLAEAIEWLARTNNMIRASENTYKPIESGDISLDLHQVVELTAAKLGIEAEPVSCTYSNLVEFFQNAAPAIALFPPNDEYSTSNFLVLYKNGRNCVIVDSNFSLIRVNSEVAADAFRTPISVPYRNSASRLIGLANISPEREKQVAKALVGSWLSSEIIHAGWMLRPEPGSSLFIQIRHSKILREIFGWLAAFSIQNVLFLLGWWLIGRVVLDGQTDPGWVWAWVLLIISVIPFQLLSDWMQNRFSESIGVIFKQRLLYGALKLNPDNIRHLGTGQLLERVMETESFEMLALGGGLTALISVIQLGSAAWVLSQGAGGLLSVAALGLWLIAILGFGWFNYKHGKDWTDTYRVMTNGLVEKMVGHRTRLAQEDPIHCHDEEDIELDHYQSLTKSFSQSSVFLYALPSSWLVVGLTCMIPNLLTNNSSQEPGMVLGIGGVMLAHQAFGLIQAGIQNDILLLLSWNQIKPIYMAASTPEVVPSIALQSNKNAESTGSLINNSLPDKTPFLSVHDLTYRFSSKSRPALNGCNLQIFAGDRIILEGSSGGGKTTFGAVLAGLRKPESGLLFLHGYDWQSLGESTWRKRVVMAPQFHENHIFNETFAFNLLLGRRWPPMAEDMQTAEKICNELGLDGLLARMPSGWQQMVGENGWQLSHGERSRVFIARALLQNADLVIMDESFGALDPENLLISLECAQRWAKTLLVIAHP